MKTIWKHALDRDTNVLMLHRGAQVLHVAVQHNQVQLWEAHDEDEQEKVRRRFRVVGTGHSFPGVGSHIGSVLTARGEFVFHVFEEQA